MHQEVLSTWHNQSGLYNGTGGYVLDLSVAENGTAPEGTSNFYVDRDAADLLSVFLSDLL